MKTLRTYIAGGATIIMLLSSLSCSKSFYTNANVNPNAPNSVPSSTLLSGVEVSLAYTQGGAASQFTSLLTQQTMGAGRQAYSYYNYIFTPADPEYQWDQMYTDVLENNYTLLNQAQASGQNEYYGIANVLMAYSLQTMVDFWGKIPYSTALQQTLGNTQPTYDNDQTLYNTTIIQLLNTGITALSNTNKGVLYPSNDDVIYGGSETDWIQFAHAIKARIFINQCKGGNTAFEDSAITEVNESGALSGAYINAQIYFGNAEATNYGPWYQFNTQRSGYIGFFNTTLIDTMIALSDPRDSIYVNFTTLALGNYYGSSSSPVEFITPEELDLIAAEANVRLGNNAAAQTAYTAALKASMTKLNVPANEAATYLAGSQGTLPANAASALHQVGVQQWIALYLNPQAWTNWRRYSSSAYPLGWPNLSPIAGSEIPRRMIYPTSEQTLNPYCPPGVTIFQPLIFWDAL